MLDQLIDIHVHHLHLERFRPIRPRVRPESHGPF